MVPAVTVSIDRDFVVPAVVARAGERASRRFAEFFVVRVRNVRTREAYAWAVRDFCACWNSEP
jgi:hypothetical protein